MEGFTVGLNLPENLEPWLEWLRDRGKSYENVWDAFGVADLDHPSAGLSLTPANFGPEETPAAFLTDSFLDFVKDTAQPDSQQPWAAHVTYLSPHPPFAVPEPFWSLVSPEGTATPVRMNSAADQQCVHPLLKAFLNIDSLVAGYDHETMARLRATYAGMVAEVDFQIGRLVKKLRKLGELANTVLIITSDHGEQLGDRWLMHKLGFYPESYHIPLTIRYGGEITNPGRVSESFTGNIDLLPTILELVGAKIPAELDGASLVRFFGPDGGNGGLSSEGISWDEDVFWEWDFRDPVTNVHAMYRGLRHDQANLAVLRDREGQYVHFGAGDAIPPLFFDLKSDPDCIINRAADPAYAETVLSYSQRMLTWRLSHAGGPLVNMMASPHGMVEGIDPPR